MGLKTKIFFFLLFCSPVFAADRMLVLDSANSQLLFNAVGRPSMIKIKGKDATVTGTLTIHAGQASGSVQADLNQFHTGIEMRDRHMKEKYLETGKPGFQNAVLNLSDLEIPATGEKKGVAFHGKLSLHGVQKDITGTTDITVKDNQATGSAHFPIKISDFAINLPTFAGATMAEEVDVEVHFQGKIN